MSDQLPTGMGRRRAAARAENGADYALKRAELIRVAADVFREKGYAAANLNDIAAKFGTDRASLYYYVKSKEDLFQECITQTVVLNLERAEVITAQKISPSEKIRRLIAMLINSQVEHYPYMFVYMQEDMARVANQEAEWAQTMVSNTHRLERIFLDTIAAGVRDGSFRSDLSVTLVANSIFGMTQWTHRWWVPGSSQYGADDLIDVFSAVFLQGIQTTPDRPETTQVAGKPATSSSGVRRKAPAKKTPR